MSWTLVLLLGATAYGFKVLGLVIIGDRALPPMVTRCLALIPPALIAAIIVNDTFSIAPQTLGIDRARVSAVGVAVVLSWRRAPFVVVVVAAAAAAALIRALS